MNIPKHIREHDAIANALFQQIINGSFYSYGQTRLWGVGEGATPDNPFVTNGLEQAGSYSGQSLPATGSENIWIGNNREMGFFYPNANTLLDVRGVLGVTRTDTPGLNVSFASQGATLFGFVDNGAGAGTYTGVAGNTLTVTSVVSGALAVGQNVGGKGMTNADITAGAGTSWTLNGAAQAVPLATSNGSSGYSMVALVKEAGAGTYRWTKKAWTSSTDAEVLSHSDADTLFPIVPVGSYNLFDLDLRISMFGNGVSSTTNIYPFYCKVRAISRQATILTNVFEVNGHWYPGANTPPGGVVLTCLGTATKKFVPANSYAPVLML